LIAKVTSQRGLSEVDPSSSPTPEKVNMIGTLVGPGLVWARGSFDLKTIQVNKHNKLTVEIHSKLP
jgi:hypothetical protein